MSVSELDEPHPGYVRQRFLPSVRVENAYEAHEILMRCGLVFGALNYRNQNAARWAMRRVLGDLVALRLHARDELQGHLEAREGGWIWSIEYLGGEP